MKTMLRKMFALLLVVAMMTSTLAVAANAEGEAQTPAGGTEQGGQGGGEGGGGGGEGQGGGDGDMMMGGSSKAVDLSGMLALKQYVFVKSEGEVKNGTVSTDLYGVYEKGETVAFTPSGTTSGVTVYADSDCTEEAEGVTASVSGGKLVLSGVSTKKNVAYYLKGADTDYATTIYVVNSEYSKDSATLTLADGTTVNLTTYAPNMANGDYTAIEGENEIDGETSFFIGANRTAVSLSDLTDTENFKGYEKAAAWFLQSGITNAGDTLSTFGDKLYGYEYAVGLYREFQIVVDEVTAVNGFADPSDFIGAMGSNDPYSDAVSATVQAGVWNGVYTQKSDTKSEGDSGFYLYENIDGVTTLGTGAVVNTEFAYVGAYNAFQSPWASLNDDGEELADALEAAAQDATAAQYKDAGTTSSWSWATESIGKASAADLFHGDNNGNFNAEGTLTRAEFAQVLYNLAGQPAVSKTTNTFKDLSQDWYKDAIEWCYENGIVSGYSATKFGPSDSITREQFAKMLSAYNDLVDLGYDAAGTSLTKFTDGSKTSSWAKTELSWAVGNGLFQGYANGTIQPTKTITRAEAATVMGRVADKLSFDYSNSAKITAVSEKLMGETTVPAASTTLTKAQAVNVLYACRNYVDSKSAPDESMSEKTGASYSDMSQYISGKYASPVTVEAGKTANLNAKTNLVSTEGSALFVKEGASVTVTNSTISLNGNADKAVSSILALTDDARAADGGEADGHVYNATTRNAFYRIGLGSALTNWGGNVVLTSTNGTLVLDGEASGSTTMAGTMAGTAYVSYGGTLQIKNAVAYSGSQHLTNLLYNGTVHYLDSAAISSGRVFSSDFWGGYQVFEDSIVSGQSVTDEPTTLVVKNAVYENSVGGNGFASQYFENSILNVGTATFQNTTSFVTDTGSFTAVNSVVNSSASTLASAGKGERAIITLVDSTVNLSGSTLAEVANYQTVNHIDTSTVTTDKEAYQHLYDGEMAIYFYGDVTLNTTSNILTAAVAEGATLTIYSKNLTADDFNLTGYTYAKDRTTTIDCGKGTLKIVNGDEYGTVTLGINEDAITEPVTIVSATYTDNYVATNVTEDDTINSPSASTNIASVTLSDGTVRKAKDGGVLTLVVNGDQYDIQDYIQYGTELEPGTYSFETTAGSDSYKEAGKFGNMGGQTAQYTYRSALKVDANGIVANETIPALLAKCSYDATGISDGSLNSYGAFFNGIIVDSAKFTVDNMTITGIGDGANDFQGEGAMVLAEGTADVTIKNSVIQTAGVIRTAAAVKENGILRINDTVIYTEETQDTQDEYTALVVPMMKRTPFALGLEGTVRATNVLGSGQGIYQDSLIVSSGWGVLSTDSGTGYDTAKTYALDVSNTVAGNGIVEVAQAGKQYDATKTVDGVTYGYIAGGSGYVAYADSGVYDKFDNVTFYGGNEVQIMASSTSSAFYTNSTLNSGHIGVMTQQNNGGLISIKDSTLNVGETGIQIKSGDNIGYTNVLLDNTKVNFTSDSVWGETLVELVQSDDAGNPGVTSYTINDTGDKATNDDVVAVVADSNATLANGTYTGNIWSNVYTNYQALNVTLDKATVNGTISSSYSYHVNEDGTRMANGTVLYCDTTGNYLTSGVTDYSIIGAQYNVASQQVNNPLNVTLTNGSTWNVVLADGKNGKAEACYVNDLTVEAGSTITSTKPVTIYVGGTADIKGTVGENVTIVEKPVEAPAFSNSTFTVKDYNDPANTATFTVVDEEGNPVSGVVDIDAQQFVYINFTLSSIDSSYTIKSVTADENGTLVTPGENSYDYTLTMSADCTVTVVVAAEKSSGGMGGGDMGGAPGGDMGGAPGGDAPAAPTAE
jgi:hypothetical protein